MERRLTPRGEERKRQLMAYATERFARHGFHPTSVAEIVDGVGVGKGVFYWYFSSKDELLLEILKGAQVEQRRRQRDAIAGEADPVVRLERGIRTGMEWMAEHPDVFTLTRFAATEDRFAAAVHRGREVAAADAVAHIQEAIDTGRIPEADPELLAHAIVGVAQHVAVTCLDGDRDRAGAVIAGAVRFCLGGLSAE